ncbi:hypothetical protein RclHR1_01680007 [Rhizophagus clarus]|uniref:Uncharacterized protein n=1 Tax=Rhizophagus clarus TaxID=94130 RepID=A0A2Z6RB35_9GLOM|nr:hypothetical protein RclHR1_01680007 [Rhizophagus clarus]
MSCKVDLHVKRRIPFTCAFMLLASEDNANHSSYLLNSPPQQDIKHVGVCGSSANFPAKIFKEIRNVANITLKCLIIPNGPFKALSGNRITIIITVPRNGSVSTLQTAIQAKLSPPYNNILLDIRQIYYPGSVDEKRMQPQALISEGDPPADLCHVVASPIPPPSYN